MAQSRFQEYLIHIVRMTSKSEKDVNGATEVVCRDPSHQYSVE